MNRPKQTAGHGLADTTASAAAGDTRAMPSMRCKDQDGSGAGRHPDRAAGWDGMAVAAGCPVAEHVRRLGLLRGCGVAQGTAEGRRLIEETAPASQPIARPAQAAGHSLDEATPPDADNWRYAPGFRAALRPPIPRAG